jgi:hypothetical protein
MPYNDGLPFEVAQAEWLAKGQEIFGEDFRTWKFECPCCGNVQTLQDFRDIGVEPQLAYQECIGRHQKGSAKDFASTPGPGAKKSPCDYAAYGLFRALKGHLVIPERGAEPQPGRDGKTAVFPFAEPSKGGKQ